ncbi:MAG: DUF58 domain-containing protein [Verrucomicrobiota bacterium]
MTFDNARFDPEVVRDLGRIDLIARVIAQGVYQGMHRSHRRGFSTEFSDFKPYTPGDDLRFLDWKQYARTDKLYIKCFEAETNQESLLLLDASRSMAWRWEDRISKLEYAANLLAAMACLHLDQQDPVGVLIHDADREHALQPSARRIQLDAMCALLSELEPGSGDLFPQLIEELAALKRRRGLIVICSDLEEDDVSTEAALRHLADRDDEMILIHILDKTEIDPPFTGVSFLEDSETGAVVPVNHRTMRRDHTKNVRRFRDHWTTVCETSGIQYVPVDTAMNYVDVLHGLLHEREMRLCRA